MASEGITKTFASAKAAAAAAGPGTIAVVLLDEVGLAEISPHNPLKVGQQSCCNPQARDAMQCTSAGFAVGNRHQAAVRRLLRRLVRVHKVYLMDSIILRGTQQALSCANVANSVSGFCRPCMQSWSLQRGPHTLLRLLKWLWWASVTGLWMQPRSTGQYCCPGRDMESLAITKIQDSPWPQ